MLPLKRIPPVPSNKKKNTEKETRCKHGKCHEQSHKIYKTHQQPLVVATVKLPLTDEKKIHFLLSKQ